MPSLEFPSNSKIKDYLGELTVNGKVELIKIVKYIDKFFESRYPGI